MILGIADSVNGVPIRLTDERWEHILDSHPEMASYRETLLDVVEDPEYILRGNKGTVIAIVHLGERISIILASWPGPRTRSVIGPESASSVMVEYSPPLHPLIRASCVQ